MANCKMWVGTQTNGSSFIQKVGVYEIFSPTTQEKNCTLLIQNNHIFTCSWDYQLTF